MTKSEDPNQKLRHKLRLLLRNIRRRRQYHKIISLNEFLAELVIRWGIQETTLNSYCNTLVRAGKIKLVTISRRQFIILPNESLEKLQGELLTPYSTLCNISESSKEYNTKLDKLHSLKRFQDSFASDIARLTPGSCYGAIVLAKHYDKIYSHLSLTHAEIISVITKHPLCETFEKDFELVIKIKPVEVKP